jgi:type III pantothenate kinase
MNLIIDFGNSSAKVGIFEQDRMVEKHVLDETELKVFLQNFSAENCIISSVSTDVSVIKSYIGRINNILVLDHTLPLPLTNHYSTPSTLGVDRLAAVCGAVALHRNADCLVIDAGTCITYDIVDSEKNYWGGAISPGLKMRFQAMHTFTKRLPLVTPVNDPKLIGDSTETCLQSGAILGLTEEINGIIRKYEEKFHDLKVILCGGDARFFENKLKGSIFAVPELVLSGLNSILIYNVNR